MIIYSNKRGIVYLVTLAICMIIMTMGITYIALNRSKFTVSDNQINALRASYYAEAGLTHMVAYLTQLYVDSSADYTTFDTDIIDLEYDIDGGGPDYNVDYDAGERSITVDAYIDGQVRGSPHKVFINTSGFTYAMFAGDEIRNNLGNTMEAIITGNIRARVIDSAILQSQDLTIIGTAIQAGVDQSLNIPDLTPDLTGAYSSEITDSYGSSYSFNTANDTQVNRVYFVDGDITINATNVSISGLLMATGDIRIEATADYFTMNAQPGTKFPALLACGNIHIGQHGIQHTTINGLIYSEKSIYLTGLQDCKINGALVAKQEIVINGASMPDDDVMITYDPTLDPENFSGGDHGSIKVVQWQGYSDT